MPYKCYYKGICSVGRRDQGREVYLDGRTLEGGVFCSLGEPMWGGFPGKGKLVLRGIKN